MSKKIKLTSMLSVKAQNGEVTGKPSFQTLVAKVNAALNEDPRFDTDKHGYPEGSPQDWEPWCVDILVPDDDGQMCAVIRTDDGRLVKHYFTWDGESVTLDEGDGEPTEPTTVYAKAIKEVEDKRVVKAAGTSEGAGKGNAARKTARASSMSKAAHEASAKAHDTQDEGDHEAAQAAHEAARNAHETAYKANMKYGGDKTVMGDHMSGMKAHEALAALHQAKCGEIVESKAKIEAQPNVLRCRDCGVAVKAEKKWVAGEPVDFQWMPGGLSTITASYNDRPITLTVLCEEQGADSVKASFDSFVKDNPRRLPFGCVEHREEEASFEPKGFAWRDDPEPGIYCTAEPTALGARNVNGKIHRSFSPCFTTDADYSEARCSDCDKADGVCKCSGRLVFPAGVRGSEANPARVTGISHKSVGSLTNWNAFKTILPIRAKQPNEPLAVKQNAEQKKGIRMKVKFLKARGETAAGTYGELEGDELSKAIAAIEVVPEELGRQMDARDAELARIQKDQREGDIGKIEAALNRAVTRGALVKGTGEKGLDTVKATYLKRYEKNKDADFIVEFIDQLVGEVDQKLRDQLKGRLIPATDSNGDTHAWRGDVTAQEASEGYVKAVQPQTDLIKSGARKNWDEAFRLSKESSCRLSEMMKATKGADFMLRDVIKAADYTDPNTQVGTLATGLILMRNLGFLKNKLGFLPYISTDLRNEPAQFGQPILTRYLGVPGTLVFIPGVGFTSDSSTISTASAGTNQSGVATQASGTVTKSVPSAVDKSVTMNQFRGTEIEFPVTTLAGTVRNLFAEQRAAQTYGLAEKINQQFLDSLFGATWSGTVTNLSVGQLTLPGLVKIKDRMTLSKIPDLARWVLLHSTYYDGILSDSNLVTAKAITALINKDLSAFEQAEVPPIYGLQLLESQLASYNSGTATAPSISSDGSSVDFSAVNQIGFAGNMSSMLFAARVPQDFTMTATQLGIPASWAVEIITEPDSGLSMMVFKYVDNGKMAISTRVCLMYGFAQGDPRVGFVLRP